MPFASIDNYLHSFGILCKDRLNYYQKKKWKNAISDKDFSNHKKKVYRREKNPASVITTKQAHEVCELIMTGNSPTVIADILNIPRSIVYRIRDRKTWQCVSQYYLF